MLLELRDIKMEFKSGDSILKILNNVDFSLYEGESVALIGPSGCGKSTLLQITALLETPTSGTVIINGVDALKLSDNEKTKLRKENLGFIYQFHNLLPEFNVLENVMIPQIIRGMKKSEARKFAENLLEQVGLSHRLSHFPKTLSGGEQQRVAIARALVTNPKLVIADEPTGNLDPDTADVVFNLFLDLVKENKTALLMATHNIDLARKLSKTVSIENGMLKN
ncbi:MAG: ABC transporter ATP-binding protein [Alphaproteobacteria bacterium]|nr:ABC transporter ATP-binding protein [Alphaproteobacteria bacterium]